MNQLGRLLFSPTRISSPYVILKHHSTCIMARHSESSTPIRGSQLEKDALKGHVVKPVGNRHVSVDRRELMTLATFADDLT